MNIQKAETLGMAREFPYLVFFKKKKKRAQTITSSTNMNIQIGATLVRASVFDLAIAYVIASRYSSFFYLTYIIQFSAFDIAVYVSNISFLVLNVQLSWKEQIG